MVTLNISILQNESEAILKIKESMQEEAKRFEKDSEGGGGGPGGEDYSVVTGDVRRRTRPACGICENSLKSATIIMIKSYFLITSYHYRVRRWY